MVAAAAAACGGQGIQSHPTKNAARSLAARSSVSHSVFSFFDSDMNWKSFTAMAKPAAPAQLYASCADSAT